MCDLCGSKKIAFQDEFQKLCQKCWDKEVEREFY